SPTMPPFPPGFAEPGDGPIPAIVSRRLVENPRGVQPGETFHMTVQGYDLEYRADAVVDDFPGLPSGRAFVVAAREQFLARAPAAGDGHRRARRGADRGPGRPRARAPAPDLRRHDRRRRLRAVAGRHAPAPGRAHRSPTREVRMIEDLPARGPETPSPDPLA